MLFAAFTATSKGEALPTADPTEAVDSLFSEWNRSDSPGCAVGIERGNAPGLTRVYGSADLEHNVSITPNTVFEAGSVSKQFTAASVLLLADQHLLALNDDVRKYIPELPDYGTPITIAQLLGHTSGLRDWGGVEEIAGWPRTTRVYTLGDVLDISARQKALNYPPGTAYSYTNTGYNLLAILVERVSKQSLADFSREHLFVPLGMSHTQWRDDFRRTVHNRAIAYEANGSEFRQEMPFENAYGNGGLLTTVGDLLAWNEALSAGKLGSFVSAELQRQNILNDGRTVAYARGLFVESYHGIREISHSGATAGYRAWLGRYPDAHLSIALLCNVSSANTTKLARAVADLLLPQWHPPALLNLASRQLSTHVGMYVDQRMGLPRRLEMGTGALWMDGTLELQATSAVDFRVGSATLHFRGDNGFVLETADGDVREYHRVFPWSPSPTERQILTGVYDSSEALASYEVSVTTDGQLRLTPEDRRGEAANLKPIFADTFEMGEGGGVAHFTHDADGVAALEITTDRVRALAFYRRSARQL